MSNGKPRPIRDAEFLDSFRIFVRRLDTHLQLIDSGEYHVRDDLATILRTLLTRGKGNDATRRLLKRFVLKQPQREISPSAYDRPNVLLAIGALPGDDVDSAQRITVPDNLMASVPLFVRSNVGVRHFTWESVVNDYGNTVGAHIGTSIPAILDDVRYFGLSETDFGTYMLRSLGVLTSGVCHELLNRLDSNHTGTVHDPYMAGTQIYAAIYSREGRKDDLAVNVRREDWSRAAPIMTVRNPDGLQLLFSIANGGRLQVTVRNA